jgi:hypothetical protein
MIGPRAEPASPQVHPSQRLITKNAAIGPHRIST